MIKKSLFLILFLFSVFFLCSGVMAQEEAGRSFEEEVLEGRVVKILEEKIITQAGGQNLYQKLNVLITKGSLEDREITVEAGQIAVIGQPKYQPGDRVLVSYGRDFEGQPLFYLTDFVRRGPLLWLFLVFVLLAVIIGGWRGASSLLGMGLSFLVIFIFILPQIYDGRDPILIVIAGSAAIIPLTFYLSHGFNQKTTVAMAGTFTALVVTGFLAKAFVEISNLTGYASEEAAFLQAAKQGAMNIRGLLLAGIIIGALGVLDDITVSQAAVVQQLKEADAKLAPKELFSRAMNVGRDHIASMVNTLILVYTGAALPLLLLFIDNPRPFSEVINYEIIAEEVIRTLVGSIGLITAVPFTTFLAVKYLTSKKKRK